MRGGREKGDERVVRSERVGKKRDEIAVRNEIGAGMAVNKSAGAR